MNKLVFACAAAGMAASATTVATGPATAQTSQVTIATDAYNLESEAGRAALAGRIEAAGEEVCGRFDGRDTKASRNFAACHEAAVADGMAQLESLARRGSVIVASR